MWYLTNHIRTISCPIAYPSEEVEWGTVLDPSPETKKGPKALLFLCWKQSTNIWSINSNYHQSIPQNMTALMFFFEESWEKERDGNQKATYFERKFSELMPWTLSKLVFWKFDELYPLCICAIPHCFHLVFGTFTIEFWPTVQKKEIQRKEDFLFSNTES